MSNNHIRSDYAKQQKVLRHLFRQLPLHKAGHDIEMYISQSYKQKVPNRYVHNLFVYKMVYPSELTLHSYHTFLHLST